MSDVNSFALGPAKIDADRDLEAGLTQAVTQIAGSEGTGSGTTVVAGAAELLLGIAQAVSGDGSEITVQLDDGSFLGTALNATGENIDTGVSVVVGRVGQGAYVVVGLVGVGGILTDPDALLVYASSATDIGLTRVAVDTKNDLTLSTGTIVNRQPFATPPTALAGTSTYVQPSGSTGNLTTQGAGHWYGFFDGNLYMVHRAVSSGPQQLKRLNKTTGVWDVVANTLYGPPVVRTNGLYYFSGANEVFRVPVGSTTPVSLGNHDVGNRSVVVGGYASSYMWNLSSTQIGRYNISANSAARWSSLVFSSVNSPVSGLPNDLWSSWVNNLLGVADGGGVSYYAYVVRPNGITHIVPDFMLNVGAVSNEFGNDPNYVVVSSVAAASDYSMYVCGGYSPDSGTTWRPAIWRFSYSRNTGQYSLSRVWQLDMGFTDPAVAHGLTVENLPSGQCAWVAGELNNTGIKVACRAYLG